ncbi:MAG: site-specific integrase [Myxococcales bacterium]|nr:site-specific integrase [Myxococcales bacterium]
MASKKSRLMKEWKNKAQGYRGARLSERTRTAYADQWRRFSQWCEEQGESPLPSSGELVVAYFVARVEDGWKVSSLSQALAAICHEHTTAGHPTPRSDPEFALMWRGLRKTLVARPTQKTPLSVDWLREMLEVLPEGTRGCRDRAILTIGFAGAFRRSELANLLVEDVQFHPQGVELLVRKSKSDQTSKGHVKVIAYGQNPATCPVRALEAWLELAGLVEGPIFRPVDRHENVRDRAITPHSIAKVVKDSAARAGLDPTQFSGHSLRAGFVTTATLNGAPEAAVMDQSGHRSVEMLRRYTRRVDAWQKPASAKLGL